MAASFQEAVVDVLVDKARRAAAEVGATAICHRRRGGRQLARCASGSSRRRRADGRPAFVPSRAMCTDNAAMVGATAWYRLRPTGPRPLDAGADPNLRLPLGG